DAASSVPRRQLDVGDAPVGGLERADREMEASLQLLIRADVSARATEPRSTRQRTEQPHLESRDRHALHSSFRRPRIARGADVRRGTCRGARLLTFARAAAQYRSCKGVTP